MLVLKKHINGVNINAPKILKNYLSIYSMQNNHRFISGNTIYTKTLILETIVDKYGDKYTIHHLFKRIIKENDSINQSVDEQNCWEDEELSPDLNDKTTESGENQFSQKMRHSNWGEVNEKQLKIDKDMPKILQMIHDSRHAIVKGVFGS